MNNILAYTQKEFIHIWRDKGTLLFLMLMPIIEVVIFGYAITTEVNNIPMSILDNAKNAYSKQLIEKFKHNKYFNVCDTLNSNNAIEGCLKKGKTQIILVIPPHFQKCNNRNSYNKVQFIIDSSNPNEGLTINSYANQILNEYADKQVNIVKVNTKMLYNSSLKSSYNFVPGIIGLILTLICTMMTAISLAKEKEFGTIDLMKLSPAKSYEMIIGKIVPYFIIGICNIVCILTIAYFLLEVPINSSLLSIMILNIIFIISTLSIGLLISSITQTQQAAMLISGIGLMLPTILLSGLIFPIENMPLLLKAISNLFPAKWFIASLKDVMIKGADLSMIGGNIAVLITMTTIFTIISIKKVR
ncbi:ABC transporter permease [Bacteroides thetaiotaomicron]|uniref:ABC transporter permease n=1 Tax=Bacteroides thetaiotaomicron TaxID=818 RepID=UPI0039C09D36